MDSRHNQRRQLSVIPNVEEISQKEFEVFQSSLAQYPHSFQLRDQEEISVNILKTIVKYLESDLQEGFKTPLETIRALNLRAFCLFILNERTEALEQINQALNVEGGRQNLVCLANKAIMLWRNGRRREASDHVRLLTCLEKEVDNFQYLVVKAKAELAFSYSYFGPRFVQHAISTFREVIGQAKEPELSLWKFGLGLVLRRTYHINYFQFAHFAQEQEEALKVLGLFQEVIKATESKNLQAKAFAEIAILLNSNTENENLLRAASLTPIEACQKALELDDNDFSVLTNSGKIFFNGNDWQRACELLNKSVSLRPSSNTCHHIGLTYRALAIREKNNCKSEQTKENHQIKDDQTLRLHNQNTVQASKTNKTNDLELDLDTSLSHLTVNVSRKLQDSANAATSMSETHPDSPPLSNKNLEISELKKVLKPPSESTVQFSWTDAYVHEAVDNMQKAIDLSNGSNLPAVYDLALMYKALDEPNKALELLQKIQGAPFFPEDRIYKINAFEQSGLILRDMSEKETNDEKRKLLRDEGESMLNIALSLASQLYSNVPSIQEHIGDIWQSFSTLFSAVEQSNSSVPSKLSKKAKLLQLINKYKESMDLLQKIEQMTEGQGKDPLHLQLCIENHVGMQQYAEAVTFIELLKCTLINERVMELFTEKHYIQKIYIHAGRQALLGGPTASTMARVYFRSVFLDTFEENLRQRATSGSTDTDSTDSGVRDKNWDVMLIHDSKTETQIKTASLLASVLHKSCGLITTRMDEDAPPGPEIAGVLKVMTRSKLVVVLGGQRHYSKEFQNYISHAARRPFTILLLVEGEHVPKMLKTHRSMPCQPDVFKISLDDKVQFTEEAADNICRLMCFILGVRLHFHLSKKCHSQYKNILSVID